MNAIMFDGVSKRYGDVLAVAGLSLAIEPGMVTALLGANGAGKSTVIGLLLGLLRPTGGTVAVHGRSPRRAALAGDLGAMLQSGELIPELSVRELVGLVGGLYPKPLAPDVVLELAGLTELAGRRAGRLSGGQAQRVRFACAIAGGPRILVLDEPTAAMDVESRTRFWHGMRGYAEGGRTVLFATHHLEEAGEHADRVLVAAGGRLVADGTPAQVRAAGSSLRFHIGEQPAAGLDRLPGVTAVELAEGIAVLRTRDADATLAALYRDTTLDVRGLALSGLGDALLALTGRP